MNTLRRMEQALGSPLLLRKVPLIGEAALTLGRWRHGDAHATTEGGDELVTIIFNLSNTQHVERLSQGRRMTGPFEVGTVSVVGPDDDTSFRIEGDADILQLFLPMEAIVRAAGHDGRAPIRPLFQEHDRTIARCALQALIVAANHEPEDDLRLSEIACELASRLASNQQPTAPSVGGLAPYRLRRAQDLIHDRLDMAHTRPPSLEELAREADLSPFHFARAFRQTVGETPHAYVTHRRIARSLSTLATSTIPVAEVARRAGFASQAHFADRFRRETGVTPTEFRRAIRT